MSTDKIIHILTIYPELSADWLLLEKGEMLRKNNAKSVNVIESPQTNISNGNMEIGYGEGIIELLNKQQEIIRHLTSLVSELTLQKQSHE